MSFLIADDMARRSHFYQAAIIGYTIKGNCDWHTPFSKLKFDIKGYFNVRGINLSTFFIVPYLIPPTERGLSQKKFH